MTIPRNICPSFASFPIDDLYIPLTTSGGQRGAVLLEEALKDSRLVIAGRLILFLFRSLHSEPRPAGSGLLCLPSGLRGFKIHSHTTLQRGRDIHQRVQRETKLGREADG